MQFFAVHIRLDKINNWSGTGAFWPSPLLAVPSLISVRNLGMLRRKVVEPANFGR